MGLGTLFGLSGQDGASFGVETRFDAGFGRGRDITDEFGSRAVTQRRTAPPADYVIEERPTPVPTGDKVKTVLGGIARFGFIFQ